MTPEDAREAARLLTYALQPKLYASQNSPYAELLARYRTTPELKAAFHALIEGIDLVLLEDTPRAILLGSQLGSIFSFRLSEYRKTATIEQRVIRGLILLGIAAYCYPTKRQLEETRMPVFSAREVDDFLRGACEQLRKAAGPDEGVPDDPSLVLAWQLYLRQPAVKGGARRTQTATVHLVEQTLEDLEEWGLVKEEPTVDHVRRFRALPRCRAQVREMAGYYGLVELSEIRRAATEGE